MISEVDDLAGIDLTHVDARATFGDVTSLAAELDLIQLVETRRGNIARYLLARDGSGICRGLLPIYTASPPFSPLIDPARQFPDAAAAGEPATGCLLGSPGTANFLTLSAGMNSGQCAELAAQMLSYGRDWGRSAGCGFVLSPYLSQYQFDAVSRSWPGQRWVAITSTAVLDIGWKSFTEYLMSLSKSSRANVRAERRRFLQSGISVVRQPVLDVCEEVAPLLARIQDKYGLGGSVEQEEFALTSTALALDDKCFALVGRYDGVAVAFSVVMQRGNEWMIRFWGSDDSDIVRRAALYFNIVYYEPLHRAIESGIDRIHFGIEAIETKRRRGCTVEPLYSMMLE